jgi:hypothetical protein
MARDRKAQRYQELERFDMWKQLTNAINSRSAQDQVLWSIFGIFWASNAILIVALFPGGDLPQNPLVGILISAIGVILSLTWHIIIGRALGHIKRFEALINRLEGQGKLAVPPDCAISGEINFKDYQEYLPRGPRARTVMPVCCGTAMVLWVLSFIFFLITFNKTL